MILAENDPTVVTVGSWTPAHPDMTEKLTAAHNEKQKEMQNDND